MAGEKLPLSAFEIVPRLDHANQRVRPSIVDSSKDTAQKEAIGQR